MIDYHCNRQTNSQQTTSKSDSSLASDAAAHNSRGSARLAMRHHDSTQYVYCTCMVWYGTHSSASRVSAPRHSCGAPYRSAQAERSGRDVAHPPTNTDRKRHISTETPYEKRRLSANIGSEQTREKTKQHERFPAPTVHRLSQDHHQPPAPARLSPAYRTAAAHPSHPGRTQRAVRGIPHGSLGTMP